jgi:hypothetical protein
MRDARDVIHSSLSIHRVGLADQGEEVKQPGQSAETERAQVEVSPDSLAEIELVGAEQAEDGPPQVRVGS